MGDKKDFRENKLFDLASRFVNETNQNIFITGKAGTGKTTFLRHIRNITSKKVAVAAPTGVAAINAGGVTLHSLFWLPFGAYAEHHQMRWDDRDNFIYNKSRLFNTIRLTRQRRRILQELELLIIDEISMVRADTLDAIDAILKSVRRDQRPFGGLQLVMIGDLLQLPPVVKENEWSILCNYYQTPYFFSAQVLKQYPLVNIEFDTIYRQSDESFINILNNVRRNNIGEKDLEILNSYYDPSFTPQEQENYITLTSHNRIADKINYDALAKLSGPVQKLNAGISKDFPESLYPAEVSLQLKVGAQVMFIKNDSGEDRRYYNGKIGYVKEIGSSKNRITVGFPNGENDVEVKQEVWENTRYKYDEALDKVVSETIGTFSQFPLRLAWAITIHKSQGLTFDKAVIDAGTSFASGQVYVALSRLTGLSGLKLKSLIKAHSIHTDQRVVDYLDRVSSYNELEKELGLAQKKHLQEVIIQIFRWEHIVSESESFQLEMAGLKIPSKGEAISFWEGLCHEIRKINDVSNKFLTQLYTILRNNEEPDYGVLHNRVSAAVDWFMPRIETRLLYNTLEHIYSYEVKKNTKKYVDKVTLLHREFEKMKRALENGLRITEALKRGESEVVSLDLGAATDVDQKNSDIPVPSPQEEKLDSKSISLRMFQEGRSIEDIASEREMAYDTIFSHLLNFVGNEIQVESLIDKEKLCQVLEVIQNNPKKKMSELKTFLGEDIEYRDIRLGLKLANNNS